MRGWRRIGVVLSVLWFVGFGGWLWTNEMGGHSEFYKFQLQNCYTIERMKREPLRLDDPQYDQKTAKIDSEHEACRDKAAAFFNHQVGELYSSCKFNGVNNRWIVVLRLIDASRNWPHPHQASRERSQQA